MVQLAPQRVAREKTRTLETDPSQAQGKKGAAPNLQSRPRRNTILRLKRKIGREVPRSLVPFARDADPGRMLVYRTST